MIFPQCNFFAKIPSNELFTEEFYTKLIWRENWDGSEFHVFPHCASYLFRKFREINLLLLKLILFENATHKIQNIECRKLPNHISSDETFVAYFTQCGSLVTKSISRNFGYKNWKNKTSFFKRLNITKSMMTCNAQWSRFSIDQINSYKAKESILWFLFRINAMMGQNFKMQSMWKWLIFNWLN